MVVWHRGQANIATPGGGWIFERQPGHTNTGSICPTACRASGGHICEPGTGPRDDFVVQQGNLDDSGKSLKVPPRCSPRDARPNLYAGSPPSVRVRRLVSRRSSETVPSLRKPIFSRFRWGRRRGVPRPRPNARVSCDSSCQGTRIERIGILCCAPSHASCPARGSPHKTK